MAETIRMPSSSGGITRYYDDEGSKIQIPPTYVVGAIVVVLVLVFVLYRVRPLG